LPHELSLVLFVFVVAIEIAFLAIARVRNRPPDWGLVNFLWPLTPPFSCQAHQLDPRFAFTHPWQLIDAFFLFPCKDCRLWSDYHVVSVYTMSTR